MARRAQSSMEFLLLVGALMVMVAVVVFTTSVSSDDAITQSKAQKAAEELARAANQVYALGPGSRATILIELPENVTAYYASGGLLGFDVNTSQGGKTVFTPVTASTIAGPLPTGPGQHLVTLRLLGDGTLLFGEGFHVTPDSSVYSFSVASSDSEDFNLDNGLNASVAGISYRVSGDINGPNWNVNISGLSGTLPAGASDIFTLTIGANALVLPGTYAGEVEIYGTNSSTGGEESAPVSITANVASGTTCDLSVSTYADSLCLTSSDSDFAQGETVYVRAITSNCTITDGNISWVNPSGVTRKSVAGLTITSAAAACQGFATNTGEATGNWTARAFSASGAANLDDYTFTLAQSNCQLSVATYSDLLCTMSDSSFNVSPEDPYVKVWNTAGCTATDVNVFITKPSCSSNCVVSFLTNQTVTSVGVCQSYDTTNNEGTWRVDANSLQALNGTTTFEGT